MNTPLAKNRTIEQEVIALLKSNSELAISKAYQHYGANLFGVISSIIREEELAQEVLQDTFLKIWKYRDRYDAEKGRLFTWMMNIARRTAIDATKTKIFKQKTKTGEILESHQEVFSVEYAPVDSALAKVINNLDEKYKVIIQKVYYEGYTHKELEEELGIPLGTVKSRIRLAISILRKELAKEKSLGLLTVLVIVIFKIIFK